MCVRTYLHINKFLKIDKKLIYKQDKSLDLILSLTDYLKLFSSLKRFLEYISLVSKHFVNQEFSLLIPLDEKGQIWSENICFSDKKLRDQIILDLQEFFKNNGLFKNFKLKNINVLEKFFEEKFDSLIFKTHKIISRGKCRGFFYVFYKKSDQQKLELDNNNVNILVNLLAVGIENYLLIKINKKHENVDREISSGAEIQSRLLPDFCPKIFGIDLAAHCRPALQLGGDYFDFMSIKPNVGEKRRQRGRWALVIGDVMGKGIPAGLLMTMLRGMLRAEVLTGLPPDRILHDLNQLAIYDLDQSHRFVTLFYSDYDPRTKKLRFANAAHNPPLLWRSSTKKIIKLDAEGFVIGIQKDAEYKCVEIQLESSDLVLYYTDGITETSNSSGERFGEQNLINTFTKLCKRALCAQDILNEIFNTLDQYSGNSRTLDDDASIVIFKLE